jgi:hypothetical protein
MQTNEMHMEIVYLIHKNKYGWCIRLGGWPGPNLRQCLTKREAYKIARKGERGIDYALTGVSKQEIMVVG